MTYECVVVALEVCQNVCVYKHDGTYHRRSPIVCQKLDSAHTGGEKQCGKCAFPEAYLEVRE